MNATTRNGRVILTTTNGARHDITGCTGLGDAARKANEQAAADLAARRAKARAAWKARFAA